MRSRITTRRQSVAALRGAARLALVKVAGGLGWFALLLIVIKLATLTMRFPL